MKVLKMLGPFLIALARRAGPAVCVQSDLLRALTVPMRTLRGPVEVAFPLELGANSQCAKLLRLQGGT